jgi:hypothetical protein
MQVVLSVIIVLCAVGYASWRVYQVFRKDGDPCDGCKLKKNCQKFGGYK